MKLLLIDQKKFLNALTSLKKAIKIDGNNEIALMNLGILFRLKKKYKLAIYYSKKLIELIKEQKNK